MHFPLPTPYSLLPLFHPLPATQLTLFHYKAVTQSGETLEGQMDVASADEVIMKLQDAGNIPLDVRDADSVDSGGLFAALMKRPTLNDAQIVQFTQQLATLLGAGQPLDRALQILLDLPESEKARNLLERVRDLVRGGSTLSDALEAERGTFSRLYVNMVRAGEAAGILEALLDRLATYMEKTEAIKSKIKSALMYPASVIVVAFVVVAVIMIFVIPAFKEVFSSFGADLPAPTLFVMAISEFFVKYWWLIFGGLGLGGFFFMQAWRRSEKMQMFMDRLMLKIPIFGSLIEKSCIARWTRTLSTMFAAGVPLVEALDSVGGASGNSVYAMATDKIQHEVSTGTSLTAAMSNANVFPSMVLQMCSIGEESGSIDHMLGKAADFYEAEVDDMVAGLSSLLEPIIIVFLGTLIGGIVVSMYLPIFKLGQVV